MMSVSINTSSVVFMFALHLTCDQTEYLNVSLLLYVGLLAYEVQCSFIKATQGSSFHHVQEHALLICHMQEICNLLFYLLIMQIGQGYNT